MGAPKPFEHEMCAVVGAFSVFSTYYTTLLPSPYFEHWKCAHLGMFLVFGYLHHTLLILHPPPLVVTVFISCLGIFLLSKLPSLVSL